MSTDTESKTLLAHELAELLLKGANVPVWIEGCDCTGEACEVEEFVSYLGKVPEPCILITRKDGR